MIEFIKHLTGLCGEPHINLPTLIILFLIMNLALWKKLI